MSSEPLPFLPYDRQTISEGDIAAVVEVLRCPFFTQGLAVPALPQAVATKASEHHGLAVNSTFSGSRVRGKTNRLEIHVCQSN